MQCSLNNIHFYHSLALRERVGVRVNVFSFPRPLTLTLENQFQTFSTDCILAVVSPTSRGEGNL